MLTQSWKTVTRIFTVVALPLTITLWMLSLVAWFLSERGVLEFPGLEPLNVMFASAISTVLWLAGRLKTTPEHTLPTLTVALAQRSRQLMLEKVRNFWIEGFLENSIHGAALIELGLSYKPDAVEHPWDMLLQIPGEPHKHLPRTTKIIEVFDEVNQALLILGDPGSGKTTLLLELARETIAKATHDSTLPIPVVFNLSSWTTKHQSISDWLVAELQSKYRIPKQIASTWVANDSLLLLLDGLDEVAQERRSACVEAINLFREKHLVSLVVCSRIADYERLSFRLNLDGAVLIQALTQTQINK